MDAVEAGRELNNLQGPQAGYRHWLVKWRVICSPKQRMGLQQCTLSLLTESCESQALGRYCIEQQKPSCVTTSVKMKAVDTLQRCKASMRRMLLHEANTRSINPSHAAHLCAAADAGCDLDPMWASHPPPLPQNSVTAQGQVHR